MSHIRGHISKLLDDYKTKETSQFITNEILKAVISALPKEKYSIATENGCHYLNDIDIGWNQYHDTLKDLLTGGKEGQ